MLFAHDTEVALAGAAALINTLDLAGPDGDELDGIDALDRFATRWGWNGRRVQTTAELDAVRALRPQLRSIWTGAEDHAVDEVNAMLRAANALPQLVKHDDWDYHLHATAADAPLSERMRVEAAMALVDVIRTKELDRLRLCAAPECSNVLIDLSKNRSRRFCEAGCGNRANVAAYRARQRG